MTAVFADTFYFLALLNASDEYHGQAVALSNSLRRPIVTTAWVLVELADGLADTPGRALFQPFLAQFRADSRAQVMPQASDLFERAVHLYSKRPDKERSLTD